MAKFLSYEDRLEIESSLKAHMTFTEIGRKLGQDHNHKRSQELFRGTGYRIQRIPPQHL